MNFTGNGSPKNATGINGLKIKTICTINFWMTMISVHSLDLSVISYFGFSFDKHRNSLNVTFCTNTSANQTFADVETFNLIKCLY